MNNYTITDVKNCMYQNSGNCWVTCGQKIAGIYKATSKISALKYFLEISNPYRLNRKISQEEKDRYLVEKWQGEIMLKGLKNDNI